MTTDLIKPLNEQQLCRSADEAASLLGTSQISGGLILGSGFSPVVEKLQIKKRIAYSEIAGLGQPSVDGHSGELMLIEHADKSFLFFCGRRHLYELPGWTAISLPLILLKKLRSPWVLLTNAAGSLRDGLAPGELLILSDHINLTGMNPFLGCLNSHLWQSPFLEQSCVYDKELRNRLLQCSAKTGTLISEGIFAQVLGPCYETPAEAKMIRSYGADAVGMSTAIEAMIAAAVGLKVAGLSCITNYAAGSAASPPSHQEVIELLKMRSGIIQKLLIHFLDLSV